jgi:REP element-mobilizing transposase RayT
MILRRPHRLPADAYRGQIVAVTICVAERRHVFVGDVAEAAAATLRARAVSEGVRVFGYCVMPDHVHIVFAGSETCDVPTFVARFKNLAQREAWKRGVEGAFWQSGFWDHVVRGDEDLDELVRYTLANPVRARLAERAEDYPFGGQLDVDSRWPREGP